MSLTRRLRRTRKNYWILILGHWGEDELDSLEGDAENQPDSDELTHLCTDLEELALTCRQQLNIGNAQFLEKVAPEVSHS